MAQCRWGKPTYSWSLGCVLPIIREIPHSGSPIRLLMLATRGGSARFAMPKCPIDAKSVSKAVSVPAYPPDRRGRASYNEFDERAGPRECRPVVGAFVVFLRLLFPLLL